MTEYQIVVCKDGIVLLHFPLERSHVCIGRHATNDIILSDESVPDFAAVLIDRGSETYRLRDLTQGHIRIHRKPMKDEEVDVGSQLFQIGRYHLFVQPRGEPW